nr:30S ribosomal protein S5 [Halomicroarcula pellucida]
MGDIDISNPQLTDVDARVLDTNIVWRHGDSGDEAHFSVIVAVGNFDGYLGTGQGREKHVGEAVKAAIDNAKTNVSRVSRDCAPMQCVCGEPHTVPRATEGRAGSLSVEIRPAQEGLGVAASSVVEDILELAGIEDAFVTADNFHGRTEPLIRATVRALWGVNSGSRIDPSGERQFDPEDIC